MACMKTSDSSLDIIARQLIFYLQPLRITKNNFDIEERKRGVMYNKNKVVEDTQ